MLPSEPPEPTPSNLLFQVSVGIQTSKPIIEALVGWATPTTRQKGGRPVIGGAGGGGSNSPEVSRAASVIVASGSCRFSRSSHGTAADIAGVSDTSKAMAVWSACGPPSKLLGEMTTHFSRSVQEFSQSSASAAQLTTVVQR